ncbi:glucan endo-1,3-beta-glucosidase-like [Papaver somniferum]|uniref:glucan endo-1,3-beta-glucosidase-like n=1 Tax=Papaver somniferum TaxID=3469 RepID=UPI000E6F8C65|nr:glucan endo-1,3-beta-glucosidase-like [Papaver somniferum]
MWELGEDTLSIFDTPDEWTGTIWARTGCVRDDHENFSCATGDCKTNDIYCFNLTAKYPVTLINFAIQQSEATYDVSLVHGYNVPVKIVPDGGSGDCVTTGCPNDVMNVCPAQLIFAGSNGTAIACHGPCDVLKDADACKSNQHSDMFKTTCPLASLFPGDAKSHKCNAATYNITFCPLSPNSIEI